MNSFWSDFKKWLLKQDLKVLNNNTTEDLLVMFVREWLKIGLNYGSVIGLITRVEEQKSFKTKKINNMKRFIILLMLAFVVTMACKSQTYASGGFGLYFNSTSPETYNSSIAGEINVGYRVPFSDCRPYRFIDGLMVSGGFVSPLSPSEGTVFNLKAGKAIRLDDFSELEIGAGLGYKLVSNDDKSRNSTGAIYSLSWVKTVGIGAWVITGTKFDKTYSGTIGMRIYFGVN